MSKNNRWLAIVNLLSGSGRCGRDWEHIAKMLYAKGIDFDTVFTGYRYHAIELTKRGIVEDGYRNVIAIGGDGTIHEVANGILLQTEVPSTEVRMGVIPVGTGNDWIRSYDIPRDYENAINTLVDGKEFVQDVAKVTYMGREGKEESRYCVNVSGAGLDAFVNVKVCKMKDKGKNGKMAYISRRDCAKALAYALFRGEEYHEAALDINGPELMTISEFIEIGNEVTGNHVTYQEVTDEENYQIFDAMGVPRTTDGVFKKGSEAPFSSEGMVTFAQAIREGKMDKFTDDFKKLTGDDPITVRYMFEHVDDYQIGERHSKDA